MIARRENPTHAELVEACRTASFDKLRMLGRGRLRMPGGMYQTNKQRSCS